MPNAELVLARLRGGSEGFSPSELARMAATFRRFRVPDSHEVHKDGLVRILNHLGYMNVEAEQVAEIARGISDYATFELSDFTLFMEKYARHENSKYREIFDAFDTDKNGVMDGEEVIKFIISLGYTPLRQMVKEAMEMVDLDENGTLDFEEVVLLMHLYRHSEGFTKDEINRFMQVFATEEQRMDAGELEGVIPATKLATVLMKFFGPAVSRAAQGLSEEISATSWARSSGDGRRAAEEEGAEKGLQLGLHFSEALLWARRLRDKEFEYYREAFGKFDMDNTGIIDKREMNRVLFDLGFTLPWAAIQEMADEATRRGEWKEGEGQQCLDFDAFVHFMQILHQTDGFTKQEISEIQATFNKFDEDHSQDIDVIELSDMLHYMGHTTKLDEVQRLLAKVDYNPNERLEFREFLRFMRIHRESDLLCTKETFDRFKDPGEELLRLEQAREALLHLASDKGEPGGPGYVEALLRPEPMDFDAFILLADKVRASRVEEIRKRAGFTEAEIIRFQKLFNDHDTDDSDTLSNEEVTKLLMTLGFSLRTVEEQQDVMQQLAKARAVAAQAGSIPSEEVNFWVVVQLLRGLYRRDDKQTVGKVTRAAEQCRFAVQEVAEFREVFTNWWERDTRYDQEGEEDRAMEVEEDRKALSRPSLLRLLRNLGLKLDTQQRGDLDKKVTEVAGNEKVDFADFLRLMRWMMDTNFANIGQAAAKSAGKG